ncbi:MAG TPA: alpha/beta fold hydrolase [Solirubrobacterales bacterium]|nr:alpha/beta fold hydrolase [Solirubrobacterales bacterium]
MPELPESEKAPLFPGADYGNPDPDWLRIDWREHLRRIDLPGAEQVNYVDFGEGEPIIFVHGIAGCWRNWLENIPYFARGNRVIALDLPGFGESPMPTWDISMGNYGRLLHDLCERLGLDRVAALVGNSMGGFIATEAVIDEPERFDRLVLISAAGISFAEWQGRPVNAASRIVKAATPFLSGDRRTYLTRPRGRKFAFGQLFRNPNKLRPELLSEQVRPGLQAPGFSDALASIWGYDTRERLTEIEIPTLVVWGLNDRIVPVEAALGYQRLIPKSRLEIFERTGHLPMLERPLRFNPLLEEFIESSQPLRPRQDDIAVG